MMVLALIKFRYVMPLVVVQWRDNNKLKYPGKHKKLLCIDTEISKGRQEQFLNSHK